MFGVEIFTHAVRMVINNLGVAIRISAVLMAVQFLVGWFIGGGFVAGADMAAMFRAGAASIGGALVSLIVTAITSLWIAVAWHRFILREETPGGPVPPFNGPAISAYFIASVIFFLVLFVLSIPISIIAGIVLAPLFMAGVQPGIIGGMILGLVVYLPVAYVGYRISPILPSAALGDRMPLRDAWYATATSGSAFIVLAALSVVVSLVISAPATLLGTVIGSLWSFVIQWATVLVGASILTTIYGHYVEGRPLNG